MITTPDLIIEQSQPLQGNVTVNGAKNAVLVSMASLILTSGISRLKNVPFSDDVFQMGTLLTDLGAHIDYNRANHEITVDTRQLCRFSISPVIMKKMRASILALGPLLVRFGRAEMALPGGCVLGTRPIDFHLKGFSRLGAVLDQHGEYITAHAHALKATRIVLEYPSVGTTENILMAATLIPGVTTIINAALEPEVLDLVTLLTSMGARITLLPPATIQIEGVDTLNPVEHTVMPDRLEAGSLLLATAVTGGNITIPNAQAHMLEVFLEKLSDMGHTVSQGAQGLGIILQATQSPKTVSLKTMPYPGFPTDLQPPMMVAQCLAQGVSIIQETVYENRLTHIHELHKMGAQITLEGTTAVIKGVEALYGTEVIASDIRASAALVIAGLAARGSTLMRGTHHLTRGYQAFHEKLRTLGASLYYSNESIVPLRQNFLQGPSVLG